MGLFSREEKITLLEYCPNCNEFTKRTLLGKCKVCGTLNKMRDAWFESRIGTQRFTELEKDQQDAIYKDYWDETETNRMWSNEWNELDEAGKELCRIEAQEKYQSILGI